MSKVLLQAHVTPDLKKGAKQMALDKGISLSELTQKVFRDAIKNHWLEQARKESAASYTGDAPL